jgi:hypothetical protein
LDQIKEDLRAIIDTKPDEMIIDPTFSPDSQNEDGFLRKLNQLKL